MNILVGCDPEVFVKQGGAFKSAWGLIKGDKKRPQKVNKGAVQVDGMALEFNIDPARTASEFTHAIAEVQKALRHYVPAGYNMVAEPAAVFDADYFASVPETAKELGCEPDFNAYTGLANPRPDA